MRRGRGRRMRGEGITPGGFPGPNRGGGGRRRRFRGGGGRGMRRRGPVDAATRVEQIAKRRGISTEQASELYKQRQGKRQERRAARTEQRIERVSQRRGINKEDARKLIADRAARRQARRAPGQDGGRMSRQERIASRKKEFLSRIREKMGMGKGNREEFQERTGRGRQMRGGRGMGRGRRGSNNDMRGPGGPGGRGEGRRSFPGRMVKGGTPGFYDRNSPNYLGGDKARQIRRERGQRTPGGRGARRGMRRRMRGGREQVGTMVGS